MAKTNKFYKDYDKALQYIIFIMMILLAVTVVIGVVFRWSGRSIVWYDEVAGIQLVWITFFGGAYASLKGSHIGMPTLIKMFPKFLRNILFVISKMIILSFYVLLAYYGSKVVIALRGDSLVTVDWIHESFVRAIVPLCSILIIVSEIIYLPEAYKETMKK